MIANRSSAVFVVSGCPRSGTSMLMQMLAAGGLPVLTDHVRRADDDNPEGYFELEAVKQIQRDSSWLHSASGKAVKIIYRFLEYLPKNYDYRVLFMDRPLAEIIASQQAMLSRRGAEGATVSHDQLMRLFSRDLQRIKRWMNRQSNVEWLEIPYSKVLRKTRAECQRISRFLGVPLDIDAMTERVKPQLRRQRSF